MAVDRDLFEATVLEGSAIAAAATLYGFAAANKAFGDEVPKVVDEFIESALKHTEDFMIELGLN
ncbi:hypothetical protein ASE48_08680 [Mycobacterium sp. Root265]|uniref:hypothetical protein n=1 Tax=Mycobacterium sp. Root265 TaxID=1736504 RepID=UPI0007098195|nr:hypothetical protein [Mycobacterium sp. Root265]KRD08626.1 hypothetical protein ASE48_08680 [Mycobacterium sp. Root265]